MSDVLEVRLVNNSLVTRLLLFSYSSRYWDTRDNLHSSVRWLFVKYQVSSSACEKACRSPRTLVGIEIFLPNMLNAVAQRVRAICFEFHVAGVDSVMWKV